MRIHVAFTPQEPLTGDLAVVVDVIRATSTIVQALASGYRRVICCAEVDEARAVAEREGDAVLGGERRAVRIEGFRFGNSPRELTGQPEAGTLVLTTTNGTRLLVAAAERFDAVLVGSILNLDAVAAAARESGAEEVAVLCAGVQGEVVLDDAYCAGRIAGRIAETAEATDSALAAIRLASTFSSAEDGLGSGQSARNLERAGLEADVPFCARESVLDVVPRLARMLDGAAEVTL